MDVQLWQSKKDVTKHESFSKFVIVDVKKSEHNVALVAICILTSEINLFIADDVIHYNFQLTNWYTSSYFEMQKITRRV